MSLGPRTVTLLFLGGPEDGSTDELHRTDAPMPAAIGGYHVDHGRTEGGRETWLYRWAYPRTGLRNPCRAGDESGCGGGRCPSGRSRQTT